MSPRLVTLDIDALWLLITAKIKLHTEHVVEGKCSDYADYKATCARIRGLREAQECVNEQLRKQSEGED